MDTRFLPHNSHLEDQERFEKRDPHLRKLKDFPLVYESPLLVQLPSKTPGIYTLTGGRQIGKTTLLKQWMSRLLKDGVVPERIAYFTGELIDDHHSFIRILTEALDRIPSKDLVYFLFDEVTYIRDWDKGVKYAADAGLLENTFLLVTGSDTVVIREARTRFPGRRGTMDQVDFHMYPLDFSEFVRLNGRMSVGEVESLKSSDCHPDDELLDRLYEDFESYMSHGGFLTAINDKASHQQILPATFATYSDWIRGDMLKRNKQEHYLLEILGAIVKRYGSQVSWNALSRDLSIDHPKTVADYVALLESMDAVFVQPALQEDKLVAAPKKPRKIMFCDPFIFHAVRAWLRPSRDPYQDQVKVAITDPERSAQLVESIVSTHCRRRFSTYYIKAKGEVDIAYVDGNRFIPMEVKWTGQLRPKQLKQIAKYPNGRILTKSKQPGEILGVPTFPLPLEILRMD